MSTDAPSSAASGNVPERLVLVDSFLPVCAAWRTAFAGLPAIDVVHGRFEELDAYDAMVSPANSYGIMDGGVNEAITAHFGGLQDRVRQQIAEEWHGYQPVGTCMIVATGNDAHPWLAHSPTMRVPSRLIGDRAVNVYDAMWATLVAVAGHNASALARGDEAARIRTLACPGLGTHTGRVAPERAAQMMALAYRRFARPASVMPGNWTTATRAEHELRDI